MSDSSPVPSEAMAPDSPTVPTPDAPVQSPAVVRFKSCRWRRPPDEGTECCGHRDVLPMAGTNSFDPEAWCPDCAFYKLRRTPKKRSPEDYRY
ncbi:MAG: hypothetical protein ABUS56_05765 [Acidobacteriota bacterium]